MKPLNGFKFFFPLSRHSSQTQKKVDEKLDKWEREHKFYLSLMTSEKERMENAGINLFVFAKLADFVERFIGVTKLLFEVGLM